MRIGVAIDFDSKTCLSYFNNEDKYKITQYCYNNCAPAVNIIILSFLKSGHFVRVFTKAKESFIAKGNNIEVYAIKSYTKYPIKYLWGSFIDASMLRRTIKNNIADIDILHAHWTYTYAYASVSFEKRLPVFCTVRDWAPYIWKIESWKNKITWAFKYKMNASVFNHKKVHFIANSPYMAECIKEKYHIEVPIIPNPLKESFITMNEHINPNQFKIICISSSNDKRKNIKALLLAFKLFNKRHPDSQLELIGAPFVEGETAIVEWKKKGLLTNVTLKGLINHEQLIEYIDKSTVFISPSLEETFGNTLIESIARKVPVTAGKYSGAVPYVLHQGAAGYLCDVSNPIAIYNAIEYVYQNPLLAKEKAEQAFNIVYNNFNEEKICKQHISLYSQYTSK